jgi:hypothetical protein
MQNSDADSGSEVKFNPETNFEIMRKINLSECSLLFNAS